MITPERLTEIRHIAPTAGPLGQEAINELLAAVERVAALADSMEWKRPAVSPCAPDFDCCGSEHDCDAMQPSVSVVGASAIRRALIGDACDLNREHLQTHEEES